MNSTLIVRGTTMSRKLHEAMSEARSAQSGMLMVALIVGTSGLSVFLLIYLLFRFVL